jgi:hypothetical protein
VGPVKDPKTGEFSEGVIDPGIRDKRLLVTESEFASILKRIDREGNSLSAVMREAWDCGDLGTMSKSNSAKATGAHVSLNVQITPIELREAPQRNRGRERVREPVSDPLR